MLNWRSHEVKNRWMALRAYSDMSPDLTLRRQINRMLCQRPAHSMDEWYQRFWRPLGIRPDVVKFVYDALTQCSGLDVGRLLPSDRMVADLQLSLICWFDWELAYMEAFWQRFDPSGLILDAVDEAEQGCDPTTFETLHDWIVFLNQAAMRSPSVAKS